MYIWDLRCTGLQSQAGPLRYKPTASIIGGHPYTRNRKTTDLAQGAAITGLTWANGAIVTACDATSYPHAGFMWLIVSVIKVWDPRKLNAVSSKASTAVEESTQPNSLGQRQYGITSIVTHNNQIIALSKDNQSSPFIFPAAN